MASPSLLPRPSIQAIRTAVQLNAHLAVLNHLGPTFNVRSASGKSNNESKKKKKTRNAFLTPDLKQADQYSLCDAIRYIQAFEVGQPSKSPKYDLAVRLRTLKNGPVVRNRVRLPHAVDTSTRICVICAPDSPAAAAAARAGASVIGEETVFDAVKEGKIDFDRCLCHLESSQKLNKSGIARILGPRGLMPSQKYGTVVEDVEAGVKNLIGGSQYREKQGVIRLAIGQLGFTPEELSRNIKTFMTAIKRDMAVIGDNVSKEIHEVVLSSTHAPGFSLNGDFRSSTSPTTQELSAF
ncbi:MAG: hypothetical protein Q9190_004340 [Brigantiaea leucoxantha]